MQDATLGRASYPNSSFGVLNPTINQNPTRGYNGVGIMSKIMMMSFALLFPRIWLMKHILCLNIRQNLNIRLSLVIN